MKLLLLALAIAALSLARAHISTRTVLQHENEFVARNPEWVQGSRADPSERVNFRLYLKQQNLDILSAEFDQRSNPRSPHYGHWLSIDEIRDIVSAPKKTRALVVEFLSHHGVEVIVDGGDVIKCTASVRAAEAVFDTTFVEFTHSAKNTRILRQIGSYSLPIRVAEHVQLISGLSAFPAPPKKSHFRDVTPDDNQNGKVVPYTIDTLYGIPSEGNVALNANSSVCLAEFQNDRSFAASDLTYFDSQNDLPATTVAHIVGPYQPSIPDAEATLDVQYGSSIAINASVWYWTVDGWMLEFAQDFFEADPVPFVVSMSWGWPEDQQCQITSCGGLTSQEYVERTNAEWQKIGLRGVTLLASSGDQGAPGDSNPYCTSTQEPLSTIFPGASPFVTSVGATMLVPPSDAERTEDGAAPPICSSYDCADPTWPEQVCSFPDALITTGGGFSDYSPRPSWQDKEVSAYLSGATGLPPSQYFNSSNRGFPDISALGHNYLIYLNSRWGIVDGTSCSSPVIGGMVALWNDWLLNNGYSTLGFINPLLYQMYEADNTNFKDITAGNNKCTEAKCCQYGFSASTGWDAATGLGAPVYSKMMTYIQNNPPGK
eukprot:TRINITY_DN15749_c1_g1_i1.p1 TRINITY_DN15749_c1_g1~~TRINITY_DN15749_c1_g1_i1.p1  ORF type:complete len:601 (+),score=186.32 TRINITY_DN15749_c1_g1_i1:28-1830(+)